VEDIVLSEKDNIQKGPKGGENREGDLGNIMTFKKDVFTWGKDTEF